ncbi:MAG: hypothetical protein EHM21_03430 [Chloroflexi bacterium]|nr:MAG: hypothetical protein EHM21_03430 [Chloroflexota bacterium]
MWIDPAFSAPTEARSPGASSRARGLVVALLTNEVYHGRESRKIAELRLAVHRSVIEAVGYNTVNQ